MKIKTKIKTATSDKFIIARNKRGCNKICGSKFTYIPFVVVMKYIWLLKWLLKFSQKL